MIVGAPWNADWRGSFVVPGNAQGYGGVEAFPTAPSTSTGWSSFTGVVRSFATIFGYGDPHQLQTVSMGELRAGTSLPWPASGMAGPDPGVPLLELLAEAGFDVGGQLSQQITPRMVFADPPSYGEQTSPIPAVGL